MKHHLFLLITLIIIAVFFIWSPFADEPADDLYTETEGVLLVPQRNVVIVVLDLNEAGLSFTEPGDITMIRELEQDFIDLPGAAKVDSILSASRVISEYDDIIVRKAIPKEEPTRDYLENLSGEIFDFPELTPYINRDLDTLLFYIYYGSKATSRGIHDDLKQLRIKWRNTLPFNYTGKAPIIAETEFLLTNDIILFFPLLIIMVIIVFSLFRNLRAVISSLILIFLSVGAAYGFVHFIGIPDSPLLLLIPVFSLGLLSDYLIHYFYHHFHTGNGGNQKKLRSILLFPLSLTALSTITGFLSLSLINGSGHIQLGIIIAFAVVFTWTGVFFWLRAEDYPVRNTPLFPGFQNLQVRIFSSLVKFRYILFLVIAGALVWGGVQLFNLSIEPYPIQQLPDNTTIKMADERVNEEFYGTLAFFIEIDTGETNGVMKKETLLELDRIHKAMEAENVGYSFSLLTVLKRMNYYFMGDDESFLITDEFDDFYGALIEQYLLYYSSSVDPLDYESLLDNSYRVLSLKGLLFYSSYDDLASFNTFLDEQRELLPENWTLTLYGTASQLEEEQNNLRNNWVLSFLLGSFLIFITVLFFYRKLGLALLSLVPGIISMVISFGFISIVGISIDAFSIVFVAIITGLVIDYSIHTLVALDHLGEFDTLEEGFSTVMGYSGIPIFLSFVTSLLSFSVLFFSSFSGARNLGFLLLTSLILSFFLSLYLIPLIILPLRYKIRSQKND